MAKCRVEHLIRHSIHPKCKMLELAGPGFELSQRGTCINYSVIEVVNI